MIVDSSAIVAILLDEPERPELLRKLELTPLASIPAPNHLEAAMVLVARTGVSGADNLDMFVHETGIEVAAFTREHALAARLAFLRFGKGRNPAGLNFRDCIAYAVARVEGRPLLCKGADFAKTDVEVA